MSNRRVFASFVLIAAAGVGVWLAASPTSAQTPQTIRDDGILICRGKFDVEVMFTPDGPNAIGSPIKDVTELRITDEWAIMKVTRGLRTASLVVPRERIVSIQALE